MENHNKSTEAESTKAETTKAESTEAETIEQEIEETETTKAEPIEAEPTKAEPIEAELTRTKKTRNKKTKIKKLGLIVVVVLIVLLISVGIYVSDYYHSSISKEQVLAETNIVVTEVADGYFYDGEDEASLLIFYPGAKVDTLAYHTLMVLLAEQGYDCYLVDMPFHLAFFGKDYAEEIIKTRNYQKYYLAGHSLGGAMAASFTANHQEQIDGLILLGAYGTQEMTEYDGKVISIYGSEDKVLNQDNLKQGRDLMPESYCEVLLSGGNHAQFGDYGIQQGDGKATISPIEQKEQTVEFIVTELMVK